MPSEVHWRLMFRVNDAKSADKCLKRALVHMNATFVDAPKPYWKIPELWEVSLRTSFEMPAPEGIFRLLRTADSLGTSWIITGPAVAHDQVQTFDGIFSIGPGRTHIVGLEWASFSVGDFPTPEPPR